MRTSLPIALLLVALSIVGAPGPVDAKPIVQAVVEYTEGQTLLAVPGGTRVPLAAGQALSEGTLIECGPDGLVRLRLNDGSTVQVFGDTQVSIGELLPEEDSLFSLSLFFGRLALHILTLHGEDMVITPTLVAGVRGTVFNVGVAEDGASVVTVDNGTVEVSTSMEMETAKSVSLTSNQEILITEPGSPRYPRPAQIRTQEDWARFRRERLEALIPMLPGIPQRMQANIDRQLKIMGVIQAAIIARADQIARDSSELNGMRQAPKPRKRVLAVKLRAEIAVLQGLARRFRYQLMRLQVQFRRIAYLQAMMPRLENRLGASKAAAVKTELNKIWDSKDAVQKQSAEAEQVVREAMDRIRGLLDQLRVDVGGHASRPGGF